MRTPVSKTLLRRASAVLVLAGAIAIPTSTNAIPTPVADAATAGNFHLIGHRGFPGTVVTENTIRSFARAKSHGATAVELDIHLTSDDQFLVMHDPTLDRTTNCSGVTTKYTLAVIQKNCFGFRNREQIPTLSQSFAWAKNNSMNVVVEVKEDAGSHWRLEHFQRIQSMVNSYGLGTRVIFHSYDKPALLLAEQGSTIHTQYITDNWSEAVDGAKYFDGVNVYSKYLTRDRVNWLKSQNKWVVGRVTNSTSEWSHLCSVGSRRAVTDKAGAYRNWLGNHPSC
jgi:glycerophosphoryl diester phosphodiesterase